MNRAGESAISVDHFKVIFQIHLTIKKADGMDLATTTSLPSGKDVEHETAFGRVLI